MLQAICSHKELTSIEFYDCISDIIECTEVEKLKQITHHISTTRFQHCLNVSYYGYIICNKFRLDYRAAARAGMLHDLFYYDRKEYNSRKTKGQISHSEMHSIIAAENAAKLIDMSEMERDIIEKHMWPLTHKMPRYKESFIISFVDKYCAVLEFVVLNFARLTKK